MAVEVQKDTKECDTTISSESDSDNSELVSPILLTPISFRSLVGHQDEVNTCCFSPDWSRLVSGGDDCLVKVWDTCSGKPIHSLANHKGSVKCCCFSSNGDMFATGSYDHAVIIWETETGQEIDTLKGHSHSVEACSFSIDSLWLCSGSWDCLAIIWSVKTGQALFTCSGHSSSVQCCTFSFGGQYMASGSWDCTVRLWSLNGSDSTNSGISSSLPSEILKGHQSNVKAVSFSSQGLLASASWDLSIILWDVEMLSVLIVLSGHTGWVQACSFSPDGNTLVSASDDQTVRVWDITHGTCIRQLEREDLPIVNSKIMVCSQKEAVENVLYPWKLWRIRHWEVTVGAKWYPSLFPRSDEEPVETL